MLEDSFDAAWPDFFEVVADIEWTPPAPHDLLFSGGVKADETAYFYSIVAYVGKQ